MVAEVTTVDGCLIDWQSGSLSLFLSGFTRARDLQQVLAVTSSTTTYVDITMSRTSLLFRYVLEVDLLIIKSSQICHLL